MLRYCEARQYNLSLCVYNENNTCISLISLHVKIGGLMSDFVELITLTIKSA
jgi:hypothetical protein